VGSLILFNRETEAEEEAGPEVAGVEVAGAKGGGR